MGKINISFNNKNFNIDESTLSEAKAALREHLLSTMNGTGATVVFDGVTYNIDYTKLLAAENAFANYLDTISGETPEEERLEGDGSEYYTLAPTALSFRSTAPLNELQEVQINGVTVDPANYTLEEGSTIVTFPIEYLKTLEKGNYEVDVVSTSKSVKGGFTVAAPELNEYGFYYNQPYTANVPTFGGTTVFFLREDGTMDVLVTDNGYAEVCSYAVDGNNLTINTVAGTFTGISNNNGIYCNELATIFTLDDESVVADNDYLYIYKEELGGYEVTAIDKTKTEYSDIKTGINGINTVALGRLMFASYSNGVGNKNMVIAPKIPDTVTTIGEGAFIDCTNLTKVILPNSVTNMGYSVFRDCINLTSITIPNNVTNIGDYAFRDCRNLTSITIGNSVTNIGDYAFKDCVHLTNIMFSGTTAQWSAISKPNDYGSYDEASWHHNVPATHVHCIDGDVAL